MKIQPKLALLVVVIILFYSCTNMKNQTKEIIDLNRTTLHEGLNRLENEKVINQSENIQIYKRLSGDLDYYIDHQDIDFTQLKKMFFETIQSFDNIRINQSVFSEIGGQCLA